FVFRRGGRQRHLRANRRGAFCLHSPVYPDATAKAYVQENASNSTKHPGTAQIDKTLGRVRYLNALQGWNGIEQGDDIDGHGHDRGRHRNFLQGLGKRSAVVLSPWLAAER